MKAFAFPDDDKAKDNSNNTFYLQDNRDSYIDKSATFIWLEITYKHQTISIPQSLWRI